MLYLLNLFLALGNGNMQQTKKKLSFLDFQGALTKQNVLVVQIIYVALALGVILLASVVVVIYSLGLNMPEESNAEVIKILSLLHIILVVISYALSNYLYNSHFSDNWFSKILEKNIQSQSKKNLAERYLAIIRSALITRLAILEGLALFGVTICLLAVLQGVVQEYPIYWLNLISSLVFVLFVRRNFPTREKIESIFREKFLSVPKILTQN